MAGIIVAAGCEPPRDDARPPAAQEAARRSDTLEVVAESQTPPSRPGHVDAGQYGAIAVGDDGYWGVGWDAPTLQAAGQRALEECSPGPGCRVVVTIAGLMCGAYAEGRTTAGGGVAFTREQAEEHALAQCGRGGARSCSVRAWVCNAQP